MHHPGRDPLAAGSSGALDPTQEPKKHDEQPGPAHAPHLFPSPALPWAAGCSTVLPSKFPVPCGSRNAPGKLPVLRFALWVTLYDAHRPAILLSSLQFCACRVVLLITFLLPSRQWKVSAAELPHTRFSLTASYISPSYPLLRAYSPTKRIVVNDLGSWVRFYLVLAKPHCLSIAAKPQNGNKTPLKPGFRHCLYHSETPLLPINFSLRSSQPQFSLLTALHM